MKIFFVDKLIESRAKQIEKELSEIYPEKNQDQTNTMQNEAHKGRLTKQEKEKVINGMFFLLSEFFRACSKMKKAQWGFSFKKSNIHFLKQLCLYFNYMK